jgi:hypothetical protein
VGDVPNINGDEGKGTEGALGEAEGAIEDGKGAAADAVADAEQAQQRDNEANQEETKTETAEVKGDPVLVTSGRYKFEETDLTLEWPVGAIGVKRGYSSEGMVAGLYGPGWTSGLDSRIIKGTNAQLRKLEQTYKREYVDVIEEARTAALEQFKAGWGAGEDWKDVGGKYEGELAKYRELEQEVAAYKGRAEALDAEALGQPGPYTKRGEVLAEIGRAEELLGEIREQIGKYTAALEEIPGQIARLEDMEAEHTTAVGEWEKIRAEAERAERVMAENRYVVFPGTPEYYYSTGFGTLNWIDEDGVIWQYRSSDGATWRAVDKRDRASYITMDGGGYVRYGKEGVKDYYDSRGLWVRRENRVGVEVEAVRDGSGRIQELRTGNGLTVGVRYSSEGRLEKLEGPEGQTVEYGYSGGMLASVTDVDGDRVGYTYEGGRLKRIVKPDGSYIVTVNFTASGER